MLLTTVARRLQRSHPQVILPLFCSVTSPSLSSPLTSKSVISFSSFEAFHRALSIAYQHPFHCFTFKSFSTQNLRDPFELVQERVHTRESLKPGLLDSLKGAAYFTAEAEAVASVDASGIKADQNLVYSVIWELRHEWRPAFLAFKWGEKWGCFDEKSYELMIWVLGNHKKFNIAWVLIRDLHRSSMNTRQAMLIMIDRYAAANDPGNAIHTLYIMEKFRMTPDEEAFYSLMNALCKYGNIEEAEEFMLVNKKLFPLETEAFNIILHGWCNICVDVLEAKRIWREMSKYCITPNAASYTHMISCFSKVGNLFDSLRLYDEMKKRGWVPCIKVYNSLIYVLARENCLKEALKVLDKIKENGLQPDSTSYNSMIRPLCEGKKLAEARSILAAMIEENLRPTMETYHALLEGTGLEETLQVLNQMRIAGIDPTEDTFRLILVKFFKLEQPENALKIWLEMMQYEVTPNLTHYIVLVEGLAGCGLLTEAREYYAEMRSNGFSDNPKLLKILKEQIQDQTSSKKQQGRQVKRDQYVSHKLGSKVRGKGRKGMQKGKEKL